MGFNWTVRDAASHSQGTSNNAKVIHFFFLPFLQLLLIALEKCYYVYTYMCVYIQNNE